MRIDKFLVVNQGLQSRNKALILLEKGLIAVNGKSVKPSYEVKEGDDVEIKEELKYVSMGGYKLEKAIVDFGLRLHGSVCADVGCSTGGFTQCAVCHGAEKVYAIDVNTSILSPELSSDKRVVPIQINARDIKKDLFCEKIDFFFVDCSFISLKLVLLPLIECMDENSFIIALIKPQFECGAQNLTKKGLVKNVKTAIKACMDIYDFCQNNDLGVLNVTNAPLRDNKNIEFPVYIVNGAGKGLDRNAFENLIKGLKI